MKRLGLVSFVLILVAIFTIAPMITNAQAPTGTYTVQPGDTGWELSRQYYDDAAMWKLIVELNPKLKEPGRVFEKDGKIILLLKPGEELFGFNRLKVRFDVETPKAIPINELVKPAPATPAQAEVKSLGWLKWVLTALLLAIISICGWAAWAIRRARRDYERGQQEQERELRQDPITSGTPYVPGGIPASEPQRLTNFFDQQAAARYAARNPHVDRALIRATRVGPIESGTIVGEGEVGYLGGEFRPRRIEQPLAAYRARYRFQDGTEEDLITLMACMNPVNFGGDTYRGFTFTTGAAAVPTPEPERPAPQPAPHPAIAVRATVAAAQREGRNTITFGTDVMEFPNGYHVVVDRETGEISLNANAFEMKIAPRRTRRVKAGETCQRATGTSGDE
ncbi:MAG: hypothetical protein A2758_01865 [Candidatus Zambryskibacteria bacterium RIFCSPHIGHO2_01_FULL_49_18]|uniref:LysM domain-containing protein n=2 Tax=Candidatus Zambryskiibacteriota TaxID=1817925 RepID=A0A1G2T311_9BACT|nr:MAG: hypothetical protein A2758_01865 [Candidatus Zambryskibacteria bacterium RIFCSPHIGHO2_01_FULL_49_18]OHB05121.1 MAG: hypothetical protein A3A26_00760 [Candidatus Zambryskibacteria bacterium RIFCSPLOWO2_01_FULL_47_14]